MKRALRTTRPFLVSSFTSTEVLEVFISSRRPARIAPMRYSRAVPPPASTRISTKSPFAMNVYSPKRLRSCVREACSDTYSPPGAAPLEIAHDARFPPPHGQPAALVRHLDRRPGQLA